MKILVTGGRDYQGRDIVFRALDTLTIDEGDMLPRKGTVIAHGCATGTDTWADEWAVVNWVPIKEYRPNWNLYGKRAGSIRNGEMLADFQPDIVLATPGGPGTFDMVGRAENSGVPVLFATWEPERLREAAREAGVLS